MTHALFCAMAFSSTLAQAHYLWLEPDEGAIRLFYGEVEEGVREQAPGKLDTISRPRVTVLTGKEAFNAAAVKMPDHFAVTTKGQLPTVTVLAKVDATEVRDLSRYGLGIAKTNSV